MMDWLSGLVGENAAHIISFIGLFAIFLVVVLIIFAVIKRMTAGTYVSKNHDAAPRLTVTDAAAVDGQRRLVLVRRDDVEHLILIGGPSDIVIETNINRHQPSRQDAQPARNRQDDFVAVNTARIAQPQNSVVVPEISIARPIAESAPVQPYEAAPDIISAVPPYKPEAENLSTAPRIATAPQAAAPAQASRPAQPQQPQQQPQAQPLQTHAQQVAAARQQQAARPAQAPRSTEPVAPKLHPAYPLGQVSRGVIAATSGLAAANNAAQQELIAAAKRDSRSTPSLDDVRPGSAPADSKPLVLQRATPQMNRPAQEPAFEASAATQAPESGPQPEFELDLEHAVAEALSVKDLTAEADISFEDLLSSEMDQHFAKSEKPAQQSEKPQSGMLNISARE